MPMVSSCSETNRSGGFTLAELLIAISLILICLGLLYPAIQSSGERAKATECVRNLREIGKAALLYAGENQLNLVPQRMEPKGNPPGFWYDHLNEYFDRERGKPGRYLNNELSPLSLYYCPAVKKRYVINRVCGWNDNNTDAQRNQTYPGWYLKMGQGFVENRSNNPIVLPGGLAQTAWFADPCADGGDHFSPENYRGTSTQFLGFEHQRRSNVLFMDGHLESIFDPEFGNNPSLIDEVRWVNFFGHTRRW